MSKNIGDIEPVVQAKASYNQLRQWLPLYIKRTDKTISQLNRWGPLVV